MRITANFFVYLLLIVSITSTIGFGTYLVISPSNEYVALANVLFHNHYLSTIVGVVFIILGLLILIMACCFSDRLQLASSIVKVSTRFVN